MLEIKRKRGKDINVRSRKDKIMTCGTCFYYNGCPHDGLQFCDELEIMTCDIDYACNKYIKKDCDFDCEKCMSDN